MDKYEELRQRLEEEKRRVEEELAELISEGATAAETREGSPFGEKEESAFEAQELERRMAQKVRLGELLKDLESALQKFHGSTYGRCDICDAEIDSGRLEVLPQAKLCMKCKSEQDKEARDRVHGR